MAKKLDRKRSYGEVMGHEGGAAFVQDDVLFDASGDELVTEAPKQTKAPAAASKQTKAPAAKPTEPVAADPANGQLAAQLQGGDSDFAS